MIMNKFLTIVSACLLFAASANAEGFGNITITPYIAQDAAIDANTAILLNTKMAQAVTKANATGGYNQRFIITPVINILSEDMTATIPQKTSLKAEIVFFVGDGISYELFNSTSYNLTGVGDTKEDAIHSLVRKIKPNDGKLQTLLTQSKKRITDYYNTNAPAIIDEAKAAMSREQYEDAISKLSTIPATCFAYNDAQGMIASCGEKMIQRDNATYLAKARSAWNASLSEYGAAEASEWLAKVVINNKSTKQEVDVLNKEISTRLKELQDKEFEFREAQMLSEERLRTEEINVSAQVASSFFSALPDLVFNVLRWF